MTDQCYTQKGHTHFNQTSPELEDHKHGKETCRQLTNQNQALTDQSDLFKKTVITSLNLFTGETIYET